MELFVGSLGQGSVFSEKIGLSLFQMRDIDIHGCS
jgi:hypothetical protein